MAKNGEVLKTFNIPLEDLIPDPRNARCSIFPDIENGFRDMGEASSSAAAIPMDIDTNETLEVMDNGMQELIDGINRHGLYHPLVVRPIEEDSNKYYITSGQRRYVALKYLGWKTAPCQIIRGVGETTALAMSLSENYQRCDMTPFEKVRVFAQLYEECDKNKKKVKKLTSVSMATISRYIEISTLPEYILQYLKEDLSLEAAHMLSKLPKELLSERISQDIMKCKNKTERDIFIKKVQENAHDYYEEPSRKKRTKPPANPWVYDEDGNPVEIPKNKLRDVLSLIRG